jgi:hypothetical protein
MGASEDPAVICENMGFTRGHLDEIETRSDEMFARRKRTTQNSTDIQDCAVSTKRYRKVSQVDNLLFVDTRRFLSSLKSLIADATSDTLEYDGHIGIVLSIGGLVSLFESCLKR